MSKPINLRANKDIIRRCLFTPYRKGNGPTFSLVMWDTHRIQTAVGSRPTHWTVGYRLTMRENGKSVILFEAEDYGHPMYTSIDNDSSVEGLMTFLTLRPGDTDEEYFADYTEVQKDYCSNHAEDLSCTVQFRFCDENGNVKK